MYQNDNRTPGLYLAKPPFDKPQSFIKLFAGATQKRMVETVKAIKENEVMFVGGGHWVLSRNRTGMKSLRRPDDVHRPSGRFYYGRKVRRFAGGLREQGEFIE